jgi:hypothetical protein
MFITTPTRPDLECGFAIRWTKIRDTGWWWKDPSRHMGAMAMLMTTFAIATVAGGMRHGFDVPYIRLEIKQAVSISN